jgi:hypothetical protein
MARRMDNQKSPSGARLGIWFSLGDYVVDLGATPAPLNGSMPELVEQRQLLEPCLLQEVAQFTRISLIGRIIHSHVEG